MDCGRGVPPALLVRGAVPLTGVGSPLAVVGVAGEWPVVTAGACADWPVSGTAVSMAAYAGNVDAVHDAPEWVVQDMSASAIGTGLGLGSLVREGLVGRAELC